MERVTFNSGRGVIEVTYRVCEDGYTINGKAYFKSDDMIADLNADGTFVHPYYGTQYKFSTPIKYVKFGQFARLQVQEWRSVDYDLPETV